MGLALGACSGTPAATPSASASASKSAEPSLSALPTDSTPKAPSFTRGQAIQLAAGDWAILATADLNGDSHPDIIGTTRTENGLAVLLGNGDGTFEMSTIEVDPTDYVIAADLDRDGNADLVATGNRLAVLRGRGDGTFEPPTYYLDKEPVAGAEIVLFGVAAADVNGDELPDLVTADWARSQLDILTGFGDGTFSEGAAYPCPRCISVATPDLNGDGNPDVVTTAFKPFEISGRVNRFLNDGADGFGSAGGADPLGNAHGLAIGDLDGDGGADVVTGNDQSYSISILLSNGDGTLADAVTYHAGNTHGVVVIDLDGDGNLDVLSGSIEHPMIWFYRGTGDGGFVETSGIDTYPDWPNQVTVADFNADGRLDVAYSMTGGGRQIVTILLAE